MSYEVKIGMHDIFLKSSTKMSFGKVIHDMYKANNCLACCVHIDATFIPLDSTWKMLLKVAINCLLLMHMKFGVMHISDMLSIC